MKVLHLNTHDIQGGAARAAYRLHRALLYEDIDSKMLVQHKSSDDFSILAPTSKIEKAFNLLRPTLDSLPVKKYKNRSQTLFSPAWLPFSYIPKKIKQINPDIVHLHWICGGMLPISDLAKINKPIIWSLHDMWAFTGGEHHTSGQLHYLENCGNSVILNSQKENDLSRKGWIRKQKVYAKIDNMIIVGLSNWLSNCAKKSSLLKSKRHICLPNPIDTKVFAPCDKVQARQLLNMPLQKKLLLFGAMSATTDPNKGFHQLSLALEKLDADIELVVFGSSTPKNPPDFKQKVHYLGRLYDDISLRLLYSAVDVMVIPSLEENLSNTIMESLACGTPVAAFDIGGNSDMIEHKVNGYLAKAIEPNDLASGIQWILYAKNYQQLCEQARQKVLTQFDSHIVAKQYIDLYKDILSA